MVKAKLIIDEKEINVLWFTFGFNQGADPSGRPSQRPVFTGLKLTIETRKDLNLAEWSFSSNQTKQIELHIYPVVMGGKTRKLYFYDCHLVNWGNNFNAVGNDPMTETLEITCAGVEASNSMAEYSAYWRETFKKDNVTPIKEENKEPQIIDFYYTDKENNRDIKLTYGDKVFLIVESQEMIGETIDLKLNDKRIDFIYKGKRLKNDTIKDYQIRTDRDKIPLTIIEEDNQEFD